MSEITLEMEQALEAWEKEYKPVLNHLNPDASWSGMMYETYGDEVEFVYNHPQEHVWTWVDGDDGSWIISGFHYVNRIGYFITEKPYQIHGYMEVQVDLYGDPDE